MTSVIVPEYTPGDWVAVVTDGGIALLPAGTDGRTVRRLWTSMRGDAAGTALVRHLQELTRDGLTSLPPFALVSVAAGRVHAVVRGAVEVEVTVADDARMLTAPHVSTWSEQVVEDVTSVTVRAPGVTAAPDVASFPLLSGVAHVAAVTVALRAAAPERVAEPDPEPALEHVPTPIAVPARTAAPVAEAVLRPAGVPARTDRRPDAGLVLAPPVPALASVTRSEVPSPAVPAVISVDDDPSDHTLLRPAHATPSGARGGHPGLPSGLPGTVRPAAGALAAGTLAVGTLAPGVLAVDVPAVDVPAVDVAAVAGAVAAAGPGARTVTVRTSSTT